MRLISIYKSNWFMFFLLVSSCLEFQKDITAKLARAHLSFLCYLSTLSDTAVCWTLRLILVRHSWILFRGFPSSGFRFLLWELAPESWPSLVLHLWESQALAIIFCYWPSMVSHSRVSTDSPLFYSPLTVCEPMYSGLKPTSICMSYSKCPMFLPVLVISRC